MGYSPALRWLLTRLSSATSCRLMGARSKARGWSGEQREISSIGITGHVGVASVVDADIIAIISLSTADEPGEDQGLAIRAKLCNKDIKKAVKRQVGPHH